MKGRSHHHMGHKEHGKHRGHDMKHGEHMKHEVGHTAKAAGHHKKKYKSGGMVSGAAPVARADKRARGGRMTPSSPLSGATVTEKSFAKDTMPSKDEGGAGKDSDRGSRFAKGGAVKHWIAGAIRHPGAEKAAAKKAGMSTHAYMEKHKHDSGTAGNRARLGLRLSAMAKHKG